MTAPFFTQAKPCETAHAQCAKIANAKNGASMQHRCAYQASHTGGVPNGHWVNRWTNEEVLLPGKVVEPAWMAARCSEDNTMTRWMGMWVRCVR